MFTWSWQTWNDTEYLTCRLLESWPHGFFTRRFWPRQPQELVNAIAPQAEVVRIRQVHGNEVLSATQVRSWLDSMPTSVEEVPYPQADGAYSDRPDQSVWVCSADCTPVLIADQRTGQVAAVHAGWRGTAAKIVPVAIARMQAQGSQLADLRVAMGPAIAGTVYQVTTEVATQVGESVSDSILGATNGSVAEQLMQLSQPPILPDSESQRLRLDVRRVNALQLEKLGLDPSQIAIAPHCTYQEPEQFFSYRRDQQRNVQWSGIVSQQPE